MFRPFKCLCENRAPQNPMDCHTWSQFFLSKSPCISSMFRPFLRWWSQFQLWRSHLVDIGVSISSFALRQTPSHQTTILQHMWCGRTCPPAQRRENGWHLADRATGLGHDVPLSEVSVWLGCWCLDPKAGDFRELKPHLGSSFKGVIGNGLSSCAWTGFPSPEIN